MTLGIKSKYPIGLIEVDFVQKRLTFEEIISKYGISKPTLSYYSKKLDWHIKRKNFHNRVMTKVISDAEKKVVKEQKSLIERLEYLRDLKLGIETKVFLSTKEQEACKVGNKDLMYLLNKSKDPVGELTKIIELLKGNATDRVDITKQEKEIRYNRLKEFMVAS